jgi:hypothetical protein
MPEPGATSEMTPFGQCAGNIPRAFVPSAELTNQRPTTGALRGIVPCQVGTKKCAGSGLNLHAFSALPLPPVVRGRKPRFLAEESRKMTRI